MGAAESPDRKRRRHDSSRERHSSRERAGPDRSYKSSREEEGSGRQRHSEHDRPERDRPASTSGRSSHQHTHDSSSRRERQQRSPDRQDRQADRSRDRSRERHRDADRDRGRDRDREREQERERQGDREADSGRHDRGGSRQDWPGSRGREDRQPDSRGADWERARDPPEQQQQQQHRDRPADPSHHHQHHQQQQQQGPPGRDSRGGGRGGGRGGPRRGEAEPEGKPKWGKPEEWAADELPPPGPPKEAPNMGLSGKLAAETNKTADGTTELKFQAPAEAKVCKKPVWKLFCYKGSDLTGDPISLTQHPFYLFGKDRKVADIPTDHPSCSRQHAVIVFREVQADAPDGIGYVRLVKPYLLDLETTNGTTINKERLEGARYYELLTGDVLRFGFSSREYVIMNEAVVQ